MDKGTKSIVGAACALWIALVGFLYFYSVTTAPSPPSCRSALACVGPADRPWLGIEARESHGYYHDAVRLVFRYDASAEGDGSGTRSSPIVPIALWALIAYAVGVLSYQAVAKKRAWDTPLSPFFLLVGFSFVFFLTAAAWQSFYGFDAPASGGGIMGRFAALVGALALLFSLAVGLGRRVRERFFADIAPQGIGMVLIEIGIGFIVIIGGMFLLLLSGRYGAAEAWVMLLLLGAWCRRELLGAWAAFFRRSIAFRGAFFGVQTWLVFAFFVLVSHNLLELMRPIPIGFDDLGLYMIIPKVLSEQGQLITGVDSYAWGIFMSLGFRLFDSATLTLVLSSVAGVLSAFAVYAVVWRYASMRGFASADNYALFSMVLFYGLPTIIFQSSKDMKVDLASLFFQLMAVLLFLVWQAKVESAKWKVQSEKPEESLLASPEVFEDGQAPSNKISRIKGQRPVLMLMGLFLGFSFVTKYTSLFLVIVLGGYVTIVLLRDVFAKREGGKTVGAWILALALPLLPILPGVAYNIVTTPTVSLATFRIGPSQSPVLPIDPPLESTSEAALPVAAATGVREELGRYLGYAGGWSDYLRLPFTVTLNPLTAGIYVDIGFIFLAFVPLLVFVVALQGAETTGKSLRAVFLGVGIVYWLLWAVLANGVIWYGYGGFVFLILGVVEVIAFLRMMGWVGPFAAVALGAWISLTLIIRSASLPDAQLSINRLGLDYARSTVMAEEDGSVEAFDGEAFLMSWIPTYVTIRDTVNAAIEADPTANVYRVGTFTKYFLRDSFARVLDDNQLDVFASAFADHDDERLIQRFKNGKFRYMIIDTNTATIDYTPERSLTKKYEALIDFIYRNPTKLKILANDTGVLFVEIL